MPETDNEIYQKAKGRGILSGQKLEFLNYLCLFGPCSTNELIAKVKEQKLIKNQLELNKLNRHPSVLKRMGLIEVHSKRKCKASTSRKEVEVLQVVSKFPRIKKEPTGRTLKLIKSSINAALLAVEIYNKPRSTFRTESFISLMNNAWTKIFHAFIRLNEGEIYYYQQKSNEKRKKTWSLSKCISHTNILNDSIKANLELFIELRNEIEHELVDESAVDASLFGECQSLLYNYEGFLIEYFGKKFTLNQSLAFALQFSLMRDPNQEVSNKKIISNEAKDIIKFLETYRNNLDSNIYDSQEFSVKLIQIPRISNTLRNDIAIKFIKYDELSDEDKKKYDSINALVKKQIKKIPIANAGLYLPGKCLIKINDKLNIKLNFHDLQCLYEVFKVKPQGQKTNNPESIITKFCVYDEAHSNYLYTEDWINFVVNLFVRHEFTKEKIKLLKKEGKKLSYLTYQ